MLIDLFQATGMARIADTMFIGFAISPDHSRRREVDLDSINVQVIATRQIQQHAGYNTVLEQLTNIVKTQLAIPHVYTF